MLCYNFMLFFYFNLKPSIDMNLLPRLKDGHLHALSFETKILKIEQILVLTYILQY